MKQKIISILSILALLSLVTFCSKKSNNDDNLLLLGLFALSQNIPVRSAAELTNESSENYADNNWGLIEHSTLQRWVGNWATEKPGHIPQDGKLIILQLNSAAKPGSANYVQSKPQENVYTFALDEFRFNEQRNNGLISETVVYQASGSRTDQWLSAYGINLSKDLVVFANGLGTNASVQDLARGVYWLRYWGADIKNLALLNGNLNVNYNGTLVADPTSRNTVSNNGFSVKQLRVDNTILTLALEDILKIVDSGSRTSDISGISSTQLIVDARPSVQFNRATNGHNFADNTTVDTGGQYITTSWASSGPPGGGVAKTFVLSEGHLPGAKTFPWADLLQAAVTGFKYKTKAELRTLFANAGYTQGTTVVSQCRTNFEAQVNGFASQNILGYPSVFYDGSLVEWTSLVSNYPDPSGDIINLSPSDPAFAFRTDIIGRRSDNFSYNRNNVGGQTRVRQARVNRNATTTRLLQNEDKAYKR